MGMTPHCCLWRCSLSLWSRHGHWWSANDCASGFVGLDCLNCCQNSATNGPVYSQKTNGGGVCVCVYTMCVLGGWDFVLKATSTYFWCLSFFWNSSLKRWCSTGGSRPKSGSRTRLQWLTGLCLGKKNMCFYFEGVFFYAPEAAIMFCNAKWQSKKSIWKQTFHTEHGETHEIWILWHWGQRRTKTCVLCSKMLVCCNSVMINGLLIATDWILLR